MLIDKETGAHPEEFVPVDKLVEKIAIWLQETYDTNIINSGRTWEEMSDTTIKKFKKSARKFLKYILSDPTICEIDPDAGPPIVQYTLTGYVSQSELKAIGDAYRKAYAGWVLPKGKK